MNNRKQLKLAATIDGVGWNYVGWQHPDMPSDASEVADQIQQWYEVGAMDMLILRQEHPYGLRDFVELVVPILQERGIFRSEYESDTLRGHLGLPKPAFRKIKALV